jgi:RNase H-like domain found in reverse transcriptase
LLSWLDDLLLHATTIDQFLHYLRIFFTLCREFNIHLHPGKSVLFARAARWCGRIISGDGVRFDPRRAQGLLDMSMPVSGADLQQFVCALNWMRTAIPSFTQLVSPLQRLLEAVYVAAAGTRTRTAVAKISLSQVGWDGSHTDAMQACKDALQHSVTLAHPSPSKRLCLYTDASNEFWSAIATQVPPEDLDCPRSDQHHEPLAFLSGSFTGSMRRWAIIEKEAYAIVISCERLDWLLQRPDGFSLYTDHQNLLYVFNPYGRNPSVAAHTAAKLIRWALRLSSYTYTIEHVPGPENVWSDMLTRWAAPSTHARISSLMVAPLSPSLQESFEWPQAAEIRHVQDADLLTSDDPDSLTGRGILLSTDGLY